MAGGYTHITLAQMAAEEALHRRPGLLHDEARQALQEWLKFIIVGSMGPDYPYLDIADRSSEAWAAAMHQPRSLELIRDCARRIRKMSGGQARRKCIAWLFGFASHCVTDGVVHPVVNQKVGPYEKNKAEHRRCEMSQDVLIHKRLNMGAIELNRQLSASVAAATDSSSRIFTRFDRDIAGLWTESLNAVFRSGQQGSESLTQFFLPWLDRPSASGLPSPEPDEWQRAMLRVMRLAESGGRLAPIARHAAARAGLTYPAEPEAQYVKGLRVRPQDLGMDFETVFDKALGCAVAFWGHLSLFLQGGPSPLDSMAGWSLDTGEEQGKKEAYVFWS